MRYTLFFLLALFVNYTSLADLPPSYGYVESRASASGVKGVCNGDPIAYIIRQHPDLLIHKRDQVLRYGKRKPTQYSLQGCIDCHALSRKEGGYHAVNDKGQFCADCHNKTGVTLDCFECHRTTPYDKK